MVPIARVSKDVRNGCFPEIFPRTDPIPINVIPVQIVANRNALFINIGIFSAIIYDATGIEPIVMNEINVARAVFNGDW